MTPLRSMLFVPADSERKLARAETVPADSVAWEGGLRPGDIIVSMNRRAVETAEGFSEQLKEEAGQLLFGMLRKGRSALAFIR